MYDIIILLEGEIMSAELIIALVTAGIALITSAVTFSYGVIQNKKNRIQKIILDNRIKYMDEIREGFTAIIGLANTGAIKAVNNSPEAKKIYFQNLLYGYGKIKTYIKPFYKPDSALLNSLDNLYDCILCVLNGDVKKAAELEDLKKDFEDKYLIYDWSYWKYIQKQKSGNYMDSDDAFDEVYDEFLKSLEK